jgi:hypothetical protein
MNQLGIYVILQQILKHLHSLWTEILTNHIRFIYMLNWCKNILEDDLEKIETRWSFDGLLMKIYVILTHSVFVDIT